VLQFQPMKGSLLRVWRWVKWPLFVIAALYCVLVVVRVLMLFDEDKTAAVVAEIHAQKITLADVDGSNLPPAPDQVQNNKTIAGIDANTNGIRDDVELAIFEKYPNDKKARAAALQYAMTEQMYLTKVFNRETWKAVAEEDGRANRCMSQTKNNANEIETLMFNTSIRTNGLEAAMEFITSFGPRQGEPCDVSA
jgi:hypothetical protein